MLVTTLQRKSNAIIGAIIGGLLFTLLPIIVDESIKRFAPVEWYVEVQQIVVSDINASTTEQDIKIYRKVKREINGKPRQELYLIDATGATTEIYDTPISLDLADYEKRGDNIENLGTNFWIQKGVSEDLKQALIPGHIYRWVWVIEFILPSGETEIRRYYSNTFTAV